MQSTPLNMQRNPGFPVANCSIKMPDGLGNSETSAYEEDNEQRQRRQQLINFGHAQWGFNNWSWSVTKQELDFVELTNGKYCAGVVTFVSITVKISDIHRENIGYATCNANTKGFAIYKSRKCAVTNALRETLLSFGGSVAIELMELLELQKSELTATGVPPAPLPPEPLLENNQNLANKNTEPKNVRNKRESTDTNKAQNMRSHPVKNAAANAPQSPPVARTHPMQSTLPPANRPAPLPVPPRPAAPLTHPHPVGPHTHTHPQPVGPHTHPQPVGPHPHLAGPHLHTHPHPRPNSNDGKLEEMSEDEARAERKRRQRLAQEEFRQKQLAKNGTDDKQELANNSSSLDKFLMEIPTQDIVVQETGSSAPRPEKRRSPAPDGSAKRRASFTKLDVGHAK